MNKNTGEIVSIEEAKAAGNALGIPYTDMFEEVEEKDMTKKQKQERKVSLHDNKSKLGKKLVLNGSKPCYCGSGKKFKFCCRTKKRVV